MNQYQSLLNDFVQRSRAILKDNLTGVYLHGSAAMGCFHEKASDLDLLVVIRQEMSHPLKRLYMDMVTELNAQAPAGGLEISVVKESVCNPFIYPTPFELHFSLSHLDWYQENPEDYIDRMHGTDKDLAAHMMIIYYRGKTLYGKEIRETFAPVSECCYFDSICGDIEKAEEEIAGRPMYLILNLCRVLAYKRDHLILSKQEGGEWGLKNLPPPYTKWVSAALKEYQTGKSMKRDDERFIKEYKQYAAYMLGQIRQGMPGRGG